MLPKCSVLTIFLLCIYEIEVSTSLPWVPPSIFFLEKLVFKFLYSPSQKGHVIKHGLDQQNMDLQNME